MKIKVALCLAAALLLIAQHAFAAGPKMELSTDTWDLGEIYQWTNPQTEITVKNTGGQDLKILDVKASCGCTAVVISDRLIKPGKEGRLKIGFASYNFTGKVAKDVLLVTNDPASPNKV